MATIAEANSYFANRLNADAWHNASDPDKNSALTMAERQLEPYRGRVDGTRFAYAVFEQALWVLQGDQRAELQQAGVVSTSLGSMSENYRLGYRDPTIAPQAWAYLRGPKVKAGALR